MAKKRWVVQIIESERGWGRRVDEIKRFASEAAARKFVKTFNAQNSKSFVPDWYMYATEPRLTSG